MRIGIYGGSFDPFHNGHLAMIRSALKSGIVDCVITVPSVCNSFKRYTSILPAPYRYYMVRDCIETLGIKNVYTSDVEFGIEGVSYTVLTLKALTEPGYIKAFLEGSGVKSKKASEDHKFYWLMGSDTLAAFETWYKPGEILDMATLLVAARPGDDTDIEVCSRSIRKNLGGDIEVFRLDGVECSSSGIVRDDRFDLCPEPVLDFIKTHALYSENTRLEGVSDEAKKQFFDYSVLMYKYLGEKRLLHTLNVGILSAHLAEVFGADKDKALIAGAIHDCAKELDIDEQRRLAREYSGDVFTDKKLLHSPGGATFARDKMGIEDKEILDAVCYHTTGRGNMSVLEKIVYLADKIEPSRTYTDLTDIRIAAESDLDQAMRMTVSSVRDKFIKQGRDIHPMTLDLMRDLGM